LRILLVSLTAVTVVAAGLPYVVCACPAPCSPPANPDESTPATRGCCCLPPATGSEEEKEDPADSTNDSDHRPWRWCATAKPVPKTAEDGWKIEPGPCLKVLTAGTDLALASAPVTITEDHTSAALFLSLPTVPPGPHCVLSRLAWQITLLPPP